MTLPSNAQIDDFLARIRAFTTEAHDADAGAALGMIRLNGGHVHAILVSISDSDDDLELVSMSVCHRIAAALSMRQKTAPKVVVTSPGQAPPKADPGMN